MTQLSLRCIHFLFFFFFNDTATTEIYTLSLHDALPICTWLPAFGRLKPGVTSGQAEAEMAVLFAGLEKQFSQTNMNLTDRKSTRLNSSHSQISYAVFCFKKKKNINADTTLIHMLLSV